MKAGEGYFSPDGQDDHLPGGPQGLSVLPDLHAAAGRRPAAAGQHGPRPHDVQLLLTRRQADPVRLQPSRPAVEQTEAAERKQQAEDAASGQRRRYQWDFDPHMDIFEADLDGKTSGG